MAKEMMIVFVFDTECCQNEADDPVEAVLYFHPSWVSDVQRISLVGQLMGTAHFLTNAFGGRPRIISLQSGKFVLNSFGRFILAVGTDRNLPSSLLEHRAELLVSLLRCFHKDIQTIFDQFADNNSSSNNAPQPAANSPSHHPALSMRCKSLSEKLYHIFETYLPILQHGGGIFQNMPISRLPKSASNIFLDAMQTLQSCQQSKGVLGGTILFHNKVLATQLTPELTKNLVLTDPYRIKSTAEAITTNFHIPVGVQMTTVYLSAQEFRQLSADSQQAQTISNHHNNGLLNNNNNNAPPVIIPFQYKKKMKRDKSIIFTNIPEEAAVVDHQQETTSIDLPAKNRPALPMARPNHLPLRFKNITSKDLPESGFSSINFDESDSFPQFIGKTSVCSTPMTEMKVLHSAVLSICANIDEIDCRVQLEPRAVPKTPTKKHIPMNDYKMPKPFQMEARRHSLSNLQDSLKKIRLAIRPFGHGLSKLGKPVRDRSPSPCRSVSEDDNEFEIDDLEKTTYRTITDPMYPVFNSAGAPISKCLFQEFLDTNQTLQPIHRPSHSTPPADEQIVPDSDAQIDPMPIDGFDSPLKASPIHSNHSQPAITPNRMALSLPLKSLSLEQPSTDNSQIPTDIVHISNIFEAPQQQRKKLAGIQLTPLMTKLSILAMNDERSSGFSSWDTTPGCGLELATPSADAPKMFRRRSSSSSTRFEDLVELSEREGAAVVELMSNEMQRCELFVCGQQNMTMLLVLEREAGQKQELVQRMFETCVSRLSRIEASLSQTLNVNVDGDKNDAGYSFLSMDPHWDTLQRGGPWAPVDLTTLECMRHDFRAGSGKTDLILRTDDAVVYGYQHGQSSIFYKQTASSKQGIPPPADAMGTIASNAKRRLERDHSIILL